MRKILVIALILVVLVSGCIDLFGQKAVFGITEVTSNPDIYLKIRASSNDVKAGRTAQLQLTVANKGVVSLHNTKVTAYDPCLFTGNTTKEIEEIRPNRTNIWDWRWTAMDTEFERECEIKFRTEYTTQSSALTTVNVLTEDEYYARETEQTLEDIPAMSVQTDNSLRFNVRFSEPQPFLENEQIYMYIDYEDVGPGLLKQIDAGRATINVPDNLEGICSSYESGCTGAPTPCSEADNSSACTEIHGCEWSAGNYIWHQCVWDEVNSNCTGDNSCPRYNTYGQPICVKNGFCRATAGDEIPDFSGLTNEKKTLCEEAGSCTGNPTSCDEMGDDCSDQPGCEQTEAFILAQPLKFVNKKAPSTTCRFTTRAEQPIEAGQLKITATYKYQFDNSLLVKVLPR